MNEAWQVKPLGDLIMPIGTIDPTKTPNKLFRYVDVSSVSNTTFEVEEALELMGRDAPSRARRTIKAGDVLFATIRPTLKRIAVVPEYLNGEVCSTGYFVFRPKAEIYNRFLFYYLFTDAFLGAMERLQTGASYPAVNDSQVKRQLIAFPALPEQRRIVVKLDEAFAGINTVVANVEKNLANARELFKSTLASIFDKKGEGWAEVALGDLGTITSSKRILKSEYVAFGVPFFRTKEIKQLASNQPITTELFISEARYKEIKAKFGVPKLGDVLLTAIGTIGEVYVVEDDKEFYFKDGNVLWLKDFNAVDPYFLKYVLISFVESLNKMAHGSAYSALPINRLNAHRIHVPPAAVQRAIVERLDALSEEIRRLEILYQRKLEELDGLKSSLLHHAFTGALTANTDTGLGVAAE